MATGALDANGVWQYGEDDSEATFSALLNKLGGSVSSTMKGRIAQIVTGTTTTGASNATTSQVDTNLFATITPKFTTSKIIVLINQGGVWKSNGNAENQMNLFLWRNSTQLQQFAVYLMASGSATFQTTSAAQTYTDTPGVTSAVTYKTRFSNYVNASNLVVQQYSAVSTITLIEVTQ